MEGHPCSHHGSASVRRQEERIRLYSGGGIGNRWLFANDLEVLA